jgi:SAM-dependent methyltransferase
MSHRWDERYARGEHAEARPLALIERIARKYPPGAALDLACGLGRHAILLAEHGWTVTALGVSEVAISRLRAQTAERGLSIEPQVQDLESPGFTIETERYDLICDCLYLQRSLIARLQMGVRFGGLVALALPMVDDTPGLPPMNPAYLVELGEVQSWFTGWRILEYKENSEASGRRKMAQLVAMRPALP